MCIIVFLLDMMAQTKLPEKAQTTLVIGYFNPNEWPVYIEISSLNLKCTLPKGKYIIDRATGQYINDPIFEAYVQPKGLSKTIGQIPVPIHYVQRMVLPARPTHSVSEATGFMRNPNGEVVATYAPQAPQPQVPVNRIPHQGMTMEMARKLGYVGKPRLVSEDYGTPDSTGAAPTSNLPDIKYSMESPPRIRTASALTPELMEADAALSPQQAAQRAALQQGMARAAARPTGDNFNPGTVRVAGIVSPAGQQVSSEPAPQRLLPKQEEVLDGAVEAADPNLENAEGTLQPLQEGESMPEPTLDPVIPAGEKGKPGDKRFICSADGKPFQFRSQLEAYAKRKFPHMAKEMMAAYPPE